MPESAVHIHLVVALRRWIADEYFNGELAHVLSDTSGTPQAGRTPQVGGYVPDAFASTGGDSRVVVGEAKTADDIERRHSMAQIEAFLRFCNGVNGNLVLAVPWHRAAYARNFLHTLNRSKGLSVDRCRVLDGLPG